MKPETKLTVNSGTMIVFSPTPTLIASGIQLKTVVAGNSINNLKRLVYDFAQQRHNLLFVGEPGSGKEVFSDVYEEGCKGKKHPFNCAGIADNAAKSALFGHVKGAYSGAVKNREGIFNKASQGMVFLDELGAATPDFQAQLLRVLETGDYLPLGSDKVEKIDDVVICAATSDPGRVRQDLLDRFITLYIPPLRYRAEDIPSIIKELMKSDSDTSSSIAHISSNALRLLKGHLWPDNIRGLYKTLQIAICLTQYDNTDTIRTKHLPILKGAKQDNSNKKKIVNLSSKSESWSRDIFFRPFTTDVENAFPVDPETYKKQFYEAHKGMSLKDLYKKYPKAKYETLRSALRRVKNK